MVKAKQVMTVKEVAEFLGVHPMTIYKYARQGKIPGFKIGVDWRFNKRSIEKWMAEREEINNKKSQGGQNEE